MIARLQGYPMFGNNYSFVTCYAEL